MARITLRQLLDHAAERLRRSGLQHEQHGAGPGDHGRRGGNAIARDPAGEPRGGQGGPRGAHLNGCYLAMQVSAVSGVQTSRPV